MENVLCKLEGRWKLVILFHFFGGKVLRFSDLERAIPAISQKMLIQQLRQMEADGIVRRIVHHQVPPKVEYCLTTWGQDLCPALDALLKWAELQDKWATIKRQLLRPKSRQVFFCLPALMRQKCHQSLVAPHLALLQLLCRQQRPPVRFNPAHDLT